jgi:ABC-type nickel/cobalt efflux system permease component RcnA
MQQFFIAIILVLGLGCWWLYSENETLKANNVKLEYAVEEQKQTIATIKESYEKQGEALMNMTRENALIEQEKAEYLQIFQRHNLDVLAMKKPGLIETRMNNASEQVMEGIEDDTEKLFNIDNPSTSD